MVFRQAVEAGNVTTLHCSAVRWWYEYGGVVGV